MMISETGAGVPGANSYASLEQAATYHGARMNTDWISADTRKQEAALIKATDYIDATYSSAALPTTAEQGLQWPTAGLTAVPSAIVGATLILALYALNGPLTAPKVRGVSKSTKKLEGVGELMTEFDPAPGGDPFPAVTSLLVGVATVRGQEQTGGKLIMGRLVR